jgi:hypothetical protein
MLYVVTAVSNPCRYASRYRLFRHFAKMVADSGASLYVAEAAYGDRPFAVTEEGNPRHLRLRTRDELWHKENLLNLAVSRLPADWKYVAWVDADVSFARPDWAQETVEQLQHHAVVQMWSQAFDLGPDHTPFQRHYSWVHCWKSGRRPGPQYASWHPGYAWACRREAFDALGGLLDWAVLGAADRHMAGALCGMATLTVPEGVSDAYREGVMTWQSRALRHCRKDIGCVDGTLLHAWHGKKRTRYYHDRWKILVENHFDPHLDLRRDWQGLYHLTHRNIKLRDDLRGYFRSRDEDSIDLDENEKRF